MMPCIDYCYIRFGKRYTESCDANCEFARVIKENKMLRADVARLTKERDEAIKAAERG